MFNTIGLVALGGAIGALLRYGVASAIFRIIGPGFPLGILTVNVTGSFLMGIAAIALLERGHGATLVPFVMVGILGGFTTFSAFSLDAIALFEKGKLAMAAVYVFGSVGLSIMALFLGLFIARSIWT
jgi:fluoride exporter